jgi:small subunit ribosomal protein S13
MARIAGIDLPREKRIDIGLTNVYGVGRQRAVQILEKAQVRPETRVKDLTDQEVSKIAGVIQSEYVVEGDLWRQIQMNIKRLMDIGCYRGLRHRRSLPVRGQRTHTNARTRKGPRRGVGGRKKG